MYYPFILMLYSLAHILRDHFAFLWEWIENINSFLFYLRYYRKLKKLPSVLKAHCGTICITDGKKRALVIRMSTLDDAETLVSFFERQPEEAFRFFRPHSFDIDTIKRLLARTSFVIGVVTCEEKIIGYFFIRSFVHGRGFLGKMVDCQWQGRGIGKLMCKAAMDMSDALGIRMFESINKNNLASMRSSSVLKQVVVKELEDGDLLIEDFNL